MLDLHLANPMHNLDMELLCELSVRHKRICDIITDFEVAGVTLSNLAVYAMVDRLRARGHAIVIEYRQGKSNHIYLDRHGAGRARLACEAYVGRIEKINNF